MKPIQPRVVPQVRSQAGSHPVQTHRRILCVFPRYVPSFGTFQHAYPLMPRVRAFMPPQGILLIAAYLPERWDVRFIDENRQSVTDADYQWADVVFLSGMHVQRAQIDRINRDAHSHGTLTVLGGPSVSGCPSYYPDVDLLHLGEIGDATDALIDYLDRTVERPRKQMIFETDDRLPMDRFPIPAYHLVDMRDYFLGSVQFSSGCPFMCEFCDIPALYGRNPRIKPPQRICQELDAMLDAGLCGAVYFVDDNFVANPAATRELLPALVQWQKDRGYPLRLTCESTLNLAKMPDVLEQMRQARFNTVFCGIETPEPEALQFMRKKQNLRQPILESVQTLNEYGLEVVSGIILGLDTDTEDTPDRILEFIDRSQIPLLTINLLYALPRTPLYDRLQAEGRLVDEPGRESNVDFKLPYETVLGMWRRCIEEAYEPDRLFERFASQVERTYVNRSRPVIKPSWAQIKQGVGVISRVMWHVGLRADYRQRYWKLAWPLVKRGMVEEAIHIGVVARHLIEFTREMKAGQSEASFYADPNRTEPQAPQPQPRQQEEEAVT